MEKNNSTGVVAESNSAPATIVAQNEPIGSNQLKSSNVNIFDSLTAQSQAKTEEKTEEKTEAKTQAKTEEKQSTNIVLDTDVTNFVNTVKRRIKDGSIRQIVKTIVEEAYYSECGFNIVTRCVNNILFKNPLAPIHSQLSADEQKLSKSQQRNIYIQLYLQTVKSHYKFVSKDGKFCTSKKVASNLYQFSEITSFDKLIKIFSEETYNNVCCKEVRSTVVELGKFYELNGKKYIPTDKPALVIESEIDKFNTLKESAKDKKDLDKAEQIVNSSSNLKVVSKNCLDWTTLTAHDKTQLCKEWLESQGHKVELKKPTKKAAKNAPAKETKDDTKDDKKAVQTA